MSKRLKARENAGDEVVVGFGSYLIGLQDVASFRLVTERSKEICQEF